MARTMPPEVRIKLGREITRAIELSGMEQEEVARQVPLNVRSLRRYQDGDRWPKPLYLKRIGHVCGVGDELVTVRRRLEDEYHESVEHRAAHGAGTERSETEIAREADRRELRAPRRVLFRPVALRVVAAIIGLAAIGAVVVLAMRVSPPPAPGGVTGPPSAETRFPSAYTGRVWIELVRAGRATTPIDVVAHWGGKRTELTVRVGRRPVYLTTGKSGHDSVALLVWVSPGASIRFGTRQPAPPGDVIAIDADWSSGPS